MSNVIGIRSPSPPDLVVPARDAGGIRALLSALTLKLELMRARLECLLLRVVWAPVNRALSILEAFAPTKVAVRYEHASRPSMRRRQS